MSGRTNADAWPEFLRLWEWLESESRREGTAIVVEGERDRGSLRSLGIRGTIVLVHRGQRLSAVAHDLGRAGRVIVLTDWDLPGGQIARKLREFLSASPVEL
ncbi:MAG TPA: toprim domain-containing protein, partial [Thermoplasmata archaeon]|nr:toprim domain-containing protein [Thermoplasmata archaeon]